MPYAEGGAGCRSKADLLSPRQHAIRHTKVLPLPSGQLVLPSTRLPIVHIEAATNESVRPYWVRTRNLHKCTPEGHSLGGGIYMHDPLCVSHARKHHEVLGRTVFRSSGKRPTEVALLGYPSFRTLHSTISDPSFQLHHLGTPSDPGYPLKMTPFGPILDPLLGPPMAL